MNWELSAMDSNQQDSKETCCKTLKKDHEAESSSIENESAAKCHTTETAEESERGTQEEEDKAACNSMEKEEVKDGQLSKRQLKKLKKKELWMKNKAERRAKEKMKKKQKRKEALQRGEEVGPSRKALKRMRKMKDSSCRVQVAVDCSFDDLMSEKDVRELVQQLGYCYAANRRVENPVQFYITGVAGKLKARLDALGDYKYWDVCCEEAGYSEVFSKDKIVYLSSESPNKLHQLEPDKAYIIGGLVDHNHHKGLCHKLAVEKGIEHAHLPIDEYLQMKSRKVLTVNHVFEILVKFTETEDWEKSFFHVLPKRKGASSKDPKDRGTATAANDCRQITAEKDTLSDTIKPNHSGKDTESADSSSQNVVSTSSSENGSCSQSGSSLPKTDSSMSSLEETVVSQE